jgi:hypothetical protein
LRFAGRGYCAHRQKEVKRPDNIRHNAIRYQESSIPFAPESFPVGEGRSFNLYREAGGIEDFLCNRMSAFIPAESLSVDPRRLIHVGHWEASLAETQKALCAVRGEHAPDYHDAVEILLRRHGWRVRREYPISMPGRNGRVDIVAFLGNYTLALELDNRTPRGGSLLKLAALPKQWNKGVLLRDPK